MLDFNFWSIFWSVLNIIILFIVLRIFLFKPMRKIMDERTRLIQDDLDAAKKSKDDADEMKRQYEESIGNAKKEAHDIIVKAHDDAEAERAAIIQRSQEEADQIVANAGKTIENERKMVLRQAQTEIADLAIEAASKIIGENLDDEKNRRIVDKFLSGEEDSAE